MDFDRDGFELDLPPEFCRYRDEGCEVAASCLRCPLPACIYDEYAGKNRRVKKLRAREMGRLLSKGMGTKDIAEEFGVTQRTVQRAVKRKSKVKNQISKPQVKSQRFLDSVHGEAVQDESDFQRNGTGGIL